MPRSTKASIRSRKIRRRNGLWGTGRDGGGRDDGFCHKHANLRTVTEYPGGEVQVGTWKYRCKIQEEIKQDEELEIC